MAEEAEWAAYLYPGTNILRNKLGIQDERIHEAEAFLVGRRAEQIRAGLVDIPRTLDGEQLKAIHHFLAQDVYSWAGQFRNVSIGKRTVDDEPTRWFIPPHALEDWFREVGNGAREVPWNNLNRGELVNEISQLHGYVNLGHAFREISGRSARIFLEQTIEGSAFTLDFSQVEAVEWNEASRDSIAPGRSSSPVGPLNFEPLERVFDKIVVDRQPTTPSPATGSDAIARLRRLTNDLNSSIQPQPEQSPGRDEQRPGPTQAPGPTV